MLDAAELRRASATDAAAVAQYLQAIDSDELDALLDQFAEAETKKKGDGADDEWAALMHALLRADATRQRTATRIIQSLWRGNASEMEAMRWVTELSLGYMSVASGLPRTAQCERSAIAQELRTLLQIVLGFIRDAMGSSTAVKTLPQLLELLPMLLNLLAETTSAAGSDESRTGEGPVVHEHVLQMLELPWDMRSVPHLLGLLREHKSFVHSEAWAQLRQSIEHLIASAVTGASHPEYFNALTRECLLLATTNFADRLLSVSWINIARFLTRQLPSHLRHEAEFNIQMCLHQYSTLADLVCDAMEMPASQSFFCGNTSLQIDSSDVVYLLHAVRVSKPLLYHHLPGSVFSVCDTSVAARAQRQICSVFTSAKPSNSTKSIGHQVRHILISVLEFGGRQLQSRLWKAQLLYHLACAWTRSQGIAKEVGVTVIESLFVLVSEVREEIIRTLLESTRGSGESAELAMEQIMRLVQEQSRLVVPHLQLFEDYLSALAVSGLVSHRGSTSLLASASQALGPLVALNKDFHNFMMVMLRKQLSSPIRSDRELALDVWCSWVERGLRLDACQEEEVVLAIIQAVKRLGEGEQIEKGRRSLWPVQRLRSILEKKNGTRLRDSSLSTIHRSLVSSLFEAMDLRANEGGNDQDDDDQLDIDDVIMPAQFLRQFQITEDSGSHVIGSSSLVTAFQVGARVEVVIPCLISIEATLAKSKVLYAHQDFGGDFVRWLRKFVSDRKAFFSWVCSGQGRSASPLSLPARIGDNYFASKLATRISLGCAFCSIVLRRSMQPELKESSVMWELLEVILSLLRLWRQFCASTPISDPNLVQPELKLAQMVTNGFQLDSYQVLKLIPPAMALHADTGSQGLSIDGILFVLDAFIQSLQNSDENVEYCEHARVLASMYGEFSKPVSTVSCDRVVFTTYAEAIASQFPKSMRHLAMPDSGTSLTVVLDARAIDELLSRISAALIKLLDSPSMPHKLLGAFECLQSDKSSTWGSLAKRVLSDLKHMMENIALAKSRVAIVTLTRRLVELSMFNDDDPISHCQSIALTAYTLVCDHVVHQPPLLRGLLVLSFPSNTKVFTHNAEIFNRVDTVLEVCGLNSCRAQPLPRCSKSLKRKRLRQRNDSDEERADKQLGRETMVEDSPQLPDLTILPRLPSTASKAAALLSALTCIDLIHIQAASFLTTSSHRGNHAILTDHPDLSKHPVDSLLCSVTSIHSLMVSSVLASEDYAWVSARALTKVLSILETGVRLGKRCTVKSSMAKHVTAHARIEAFQSVVQMVIRGRAWLVSLRNSSDVAPSKAKLSSTLLKLDVFLLDVPVLTGALTRDDDMPEDSRSSLRAFLASVEAAVASTTTSIVKSGSTSTVKKSSRRHLVGIVPVVRKRRQRLRSRHAYIDSCLAEEDGDDAFVDLEDFIA